MDEELLNILVDLLSIDEVPEEMLTAYWKLNNYVERSTGCKVEQLIFLKNL